jgi:hypothetical protein
MSPIGISKVIYTFGEWMANEYLSHESLKKLVDANETFDVCILENFNAEAIMVKLTVFKRFKFENIEIRF